jgi:hypothetical protein
VAAELEHVFAGVAAWGGEEGSEDLVYTISGLRMCKPAERRFAFREAVIETPIEDASYVGSRHADDRDG